MTDTINRRRFPILLASALALLAILGALFLPDRAQAQSTTEIWSETLTVASISGQVIVGWDGVSGSLGSTAADRTFSYNSKSYRFLLAQNVVQASSNQLLIRVNSSFDQAALSDLILVVDSDEFPLADASISTSTSTGNDTARWNNAGLSWSDGDSVSLSLKAITGRPDLDSSGVGFDGNRISLIFDENLGSPLPRKSAFSITADGSPISIGNITRGNSGLLNLSSLSPVIGKGQRVRLSYTDPTTGNDSNAIQDTDGVDASSFTVTVGNQSTVTLPALSEAEVLANGQVIALTFSRDLDFSGTFTATIRDAFSVTVDGTANAVTGFGGSGDTASLTMSDTIEEDQTVVVGYDRSDAGSEALGTSSTKLVADFTTGEDGVLAVTNNSTAGPAKLASVTVNAAGTELTLTFNKALNAVPLGETTGIQNRFTATAEGVEVAITGSQGLTSADDNFKLLFNTSAPVYKDEAVVVTYVKPTGSDGLTDEANDVPVVSFTTGQGGVPAVTNNSTVVAPPRLASAEVQAGGNEIYLGFSVALDVPATVAEALKDAFTVTVDGEERAFADLVFFGLGDTFVKLVFTETLIPAGASVVVSYDQSDAGTSALEGTASNEVLDFTTGAGGVVAVTNNSDTVRLLGSEFRLASANGNSVGIWSNGTTVWVADSSDDMLYAYALDDGTRQDGTGSTTDVEFDLHSDNGSPRGIWSNGTTVWVADSSDDMLYAYALDDGTRQDGTGSTTDMEFDLDSDNGDAKGIWSDGTTIWVANLEAFGSEVFAYALADGTRQDGTGSTTDMEFDLDSDNGAPVGMWSDTTTIWVADSVSDQVYAYQMSDKSRDESREFDFDSGNTDPWGIWSDYSTMWVVDAGEKDLFAYLLVGTATAPEAPTGLTATALGATIVDLAWTAPADDGGAAITGYKVEVSNTGSSGWSDLEDDTGNADAWYRHSGLSNGDTRHYRVSAINAAGTSPASASDDATTMTGDHHAAPADIYGDVLLSATLTVGTTPAGPGYLIGPPELGSLSSNTFEYGGTTFTLSSILPVPALDALSFGYGAPLGSGLFTMHGGPSSGEFPGHAVATSATLSVDTSNWQHGDTVDVRLVEATAPAKPTGLSATAAGNAQIDLAWTAPEDDGGRAVSGYKVEVSEDGSTGSWDDLVADTGSADTEYSHTGLSAGDTRHYRVSAINAAGTSDASDSDAATTQRAAPDPPTLRSAAVNEIGNQIYMTFNENLDFSSGAAAPASAFSVSVDGAAIAVGGAARGLNAKELWLLQFDSTMYQGQNVTVTYTDPTSGDDAAAIQDSDGDDTPSFTTGQGGVPAVVNNSMLTAPLPAPTGFRADPGDGEVTLSWNPPGSGSGVTHHDYRFKTDGSYGGWIEIDDSGPGETNASGFTVTENIENGAAHTFQLRAGNADDDSPAAVSEEVTPMEAALDPPTNLEATAGDRRAFLTWTPPAADSGYTQHQYRYREEDGNWEHWKTVADSGPGGANGRRFTVPDLRNATEHSFELRASDGGAGRSPAATTDVTPQGPPRITLVAVTSSPGLDNGTTYGAGEEIRIAVTFDQDVAVTGNPRFRLDLGASDRQAGYDTGNGTETLVFVYRVRAGDRDDDGIWIGANVIRLNGGGIGNGEGHDADLAHEGIGQLPGHKVNGAREVGMHEHEAFTHGHSHFNNGKGYYTEEYPSHEHEGHEHPDEANGHRSLNGPLEVHTHHLPENPNSSVSGGPDERGHGGVEHVHRCYSLKPSCNQGYDYNRRGGELGLPIEVTHSHAADSEPGHGFDWDEWFEGRGPDATGATVSVADAEAVGGEDAHLRFEVTLEPAQEFAVRVDYATADGMATAGEDYRETSGVLEIPPGETRATVRVPVRDRAPDDGDETLTLTLRSATAVTVADGEATGTIRAPAATTPPEIDDIDVVSTPRLRSDGSSKADTYGEGENIRIEVEFDQPVLVEGEPVMMLEVCDPGGSLCEAEARYESGSGTDTLVFVYLVFEWDRDRNGIAIPEDPIDVSIDDLEDFHIRNAAGQEADLSHRREGTKSGHKVNGARQAGQYLWVEDAEAHEADGEMAFTVRLEPRGLGIVTVDYATRDGSARAGSDYTQTSGRLRFNPLERERTVTVPVADDAHQDDGETFRLRLSNPDGALLGDREATGTIHNSDPPALSASFPASAYASASHSGAEDRPQAVAEFSETVAEFAADTPSVSVAGGAVASVQPHTEDGLEHAWLFVLAPDGDGDVTFALVADAACDEGGICTPDGRALTEASEASTIPGPGEAAETAEETAEPPDKPRGLGATATHDAITLTWDDPDDDSITGYVILRRLPGVDQEGHFNELVANTGSAATTYTDNDVAAETRYTYRIKAINEHGTSERSRWAHIDTPAAPEPETPPEPDNSPAIGAPTISGTAQVGETLTANTSGIADADGLSNVRYEYQWLGDGAAIQGATARAYTLADSDEGKAVRVRVSFTDDAGNEESLTSAATAAVAAAEPAEPPDKPRGLEATASHDAITLTWDDPGDDSITGYVILRRLPGVDPEGQFDELVADTGTAATTYTDSSVEAETRYTYRIKAINEHGTSERSRWYHIDTPAAP